MDGVALGRDAELLGADPGQRAQVAATRACSRAPPCAAPRPPRSNENGIFMRRILALLKSRSVCSLQAEDRRAVDGVVGAHALERAAAVVQRVRQHVDLGVAPFDQRAIHPDLAVAVGHRHGALHRRLRGADSRWRCESSRCARCRSPAATPRRGGRGSGARRRRHVRRRSARSARSRESKRKHRVAAPVADPDLVAAVDPDRVGPRAVAGQAPLAPAARRRIVDREVAAQPFADPDAAAAVAPDAARAEPRLAESYGTWRSSTCQRPSRRCSAIA